MVAFAISIAIHEILAGFITRPGITPEQERETVARVTITRVVPPTTPTPKPTPPPPTPPPITFAHAPIVVARAAPLTAIHRDAAPQPQPAVVQTALASAVPSPASGEGAGAGDQAGAGSPGEGGSGGGANEPCGGVTFVDHGSHGDPATHGFFVTIRMSVSFPDGHSESTILDYPFYYSDAASDPWSEQNRSNMDVPMLMQTPPPALASGEPPLVQYVVKHTAADGFTLMAPCPGAAPH